MEKAKELLEKLKKDKKAALIALLTLAAVFLLALSGPAAKKEKGGEVPTEQTTADYSALLEKRLMELISSIEGAGTVKVMVTLEGGEEQVFARDNDSSAETGADGRSNWEEKYEYLVIDGEAVRIKVLSPKVMGVAVVCGGAGDPAVRERITETVCALLGVSASRVSVTKMK